MDYEKRKPSKPKKKIKEKSNSDVFNEQIRRNSGHSASGKIDNVTSAQVR